MDKKSQEAVHIDPVHLFCHTTCTGPQDPSNHVSTLLHSLLRIRLHLSRTSATFSIVAMLCRGFTGSGTTAPCRAEPGTNLECLDLRGRDVLSFWIYFDWVGSMFAHL